MKMTNMKWALVGIPIALVLFGTVGVSLSSVLPLAFLIACPLMMMGMHGGHGKGHTAQDKTPSNLHDH
jgi:Na+/glutamate symporter